MSAHIRLQTRVADYLAERRRLGFELHSHDTLLADFAQFVANRHHHGPLTVELMADWVRTGKGGLGTPETWYRRMEKLRRFIRYLQQFEPQTEMPDEAIFGPEPGRVAPHIYREEEIVDLMADENSWMHTTDTSLADEDSMSDAEEDITEDDDMASEMDREPGAAFGMTEDDVVGDDADGDVGP